MTVSIFIIRLICNITQGTHCWNWWHDAIRYCAANFQIRNIYRTIVQWKRPSKGSRIIDQQLLNALHIDFFTIVIIHTAISAKIKKDRLPLAGRHGFSLTVGIFNISVLAGIIAIIIKITVCLTGTHGLICIDIVHIFKINIIG